MKTQTTLYRKIWHGLVAELYENDTLETQSFIAMFTHGMTIDEMFEDLMIDGVALALINKHKYHHQLDVSAIPRNNNYSKCSPERFLWHEMITVMHDDYAYETEVFNHLMNGISLKIIIKSKIREQMEECMCELEEMSKTANHKMELSMQNKDNITLSDIVERFREYNRQHGFTYGGRHPNGIPCIYAVIVYKQSNFTKPYSEEQRSYRVNNLGGKRFFDGMLGNSVFGDCLDGSEEYLRLDVLDWEIERCYFEAA